MEVQLSDYYEKRSLTFYFELLSMTRRSSKLGAKTFRMRSYVPDMQQGYFALQKSPQKVVLVVVAAILISACSRNEPIGVSHKDPTYMRELSSRMRQAGISFKAGDDGVIWYSPESAERVKQITDDLDKPYVETRLLTEELREYFLSELKARNRRYQMVTINGEIVIHWWPKDSGEEQEMRDRIAKEMLNKRQQ